MRFNRNRFLTKTSVKALCFAFACVLFLAQIACVARMATNFVKPDPPTSFFKENETEWTVIPISTGLNPETAWSKAVEAVSSRYDVDLLDHRAHQLRTIFRVSKIGGSWGVETHYRTRVMLRLGTEKDRLLLKVEARFGSETDFDPGTDKEVLERLKQNINAALGTGDGNF